MSEQFKREIRYSVIKIATGRPVECVVVESDWPEYEIVWKMIQDRMEGRPNELTELRNEKALLTTQVAMQDQQAKRLIWLHQKLREDTWHIESIREFQKEVSDLEGEILSAWLRQTA